MSTGVEMQAGQPLEVKRYSSASVIGAALGGAVVAFLLSWVYGPAEYYSPIDYLNFALAYGMAWLVGRATRKMLQARKINGVNAATLAGAVAGFFALYFSWCTYYWTLTDYSFTTYFYYLLRPYEIIDTIMLLAEEPIWTWGSSNRNAMPEYFYYAVWLAEAGALIGVPMVMCRQYVKNNILCDRCGEWVRPTGDIAYFNASEVKEEFYRPRLDSGDASVILQLPRQSTTDPAPIWLEVVGLACPYCEDQDSYVNVFYGTYKEVKKKKKPEIIRIQIASFLPVSVDLEKALFEPAPVEEPEAASAEDAPILAEEPAANQ